MQQYPGVPTSAGGARCPNNCLPNLSLLMHLGFRCRLISCITNMIESISYSVQSSSVFAVLLKAPFDGKRLQASSPFYRTAVLINAVLQM